MVVPKPVTAPLAILPLVFLFAVLEARTLNEPFHEPMISVKWRGKSSSRGTRSDGAAFPAGRPKDDGMFAESFQVQCEGTFYLRGRF